MSTAAHAIDELADFANSTSSRSCSMPRAARCTSRARRSRGRATRERPTDRAPGRPRRCATSASTRTAPASCAASRSLAHSPLEQIERLEQLRVLWHGDRIAVHVSASAPGRRRRHRRGSRARAPCSLPPKLVRVLPEPATADEADPAAYIPACTCHPQNLTPMRLDSSGRTRRRQGNASGVHLPEIRHSADLDRRHAARRGEGRHAAGTGRQAGDGRRRAW